MKHVFIINPKAGKQDMTFPLDTAIRENFAALRPGDTYVIRTTEYPGHAKQLAAEAVAEGVPVRLYACGGDGTLNEVLNGCAGAKHCEFAPFPCGTGNDFIKSFEEELRQDFFDIKTLIAGEAAPIDLLQVGDLYSMNIVSAGFDSAIAENVHRFSTLPLVRGRMAYNLSLVYCFFRSLKNRYAFVFDGESIPPADYVFAVAANGQYYGGGYCAAPTARLDDGLMDFVLINTISRLRVLSLVGKYKRGEHLAVTDVVTLRNGKTLQILADEPLRMNLDGEIVEMKDPVIRLREKALALVLPDRVLKNTDRLTRGNAAPASVK